MSQDNWPYPTTPEPKRSSAPLAWVLVGVLTVALTATALVAVGTLQDRDTMIASQHDELNAISDELETAQDDLADAEAARDECEAEATAYYNSLMEMTTAMSDWLIVYPYGTLDLDKATEYVDEANELGCLS